MIADGLCPHCKQLPSSHSDWCEIGRSSLHEEFAAAEAGVPTQEPDKGAERWFDNGITLNLYQAQKLVEYFGGEDTMVTIKFILPKPEYEIAGLCCWCSDYPEEGAECLLPSPPEEGHE